MAASPAAVWPQLIRQCDCEGPGVLHRLDKTRARIVCIGPYTSGDAPGCIDRRFTRLMDHEIDWSPPLHAQGTGKSPWSTQDDRTNTVPPLDVNV